MNNSKILLAGVAALVVAYTGHVIRTISSDSHPKKGDKDKNETK